MLPVALGFLGPDHHGSPRVESVGPVEGEIVEQDAIESYLDQWTALRLQGPQQPDFDKEREYFARADV